MTFHHQKCGIKAGFKKVLRVSIRQITEEFHLRSPEPLLALLFWVCSISLKTVSVRFEFGKICKMVLLRGDGVVNYRKSHTADGLSLENAGGPSQNYHRLEPVPVRGSFPPVNRLSK